MLLVDVEDLGFSRSEPVYDLHLNVGPNTAIAPDLLDRLVQSFVSDRRGPDVVRLVFSDGVHTFPLYLRIRLLREVHLAAVDYNLPDPESNAEYDANPALYFEAWIDQPEFDPRPTAAAIRCFIESASADVSDARFGAYDAGQMQFINKPPNFPF